MKLNDSEVLISNLTLQLREKISKLEAASLAEKQWQMSGEIGATSRPENSLLEEHLMYDQTVRLGTPKSSKQYPSFSVIC